MARKLILPTRAEDKKISRGIARDPSMPEWTEQNFAAARQAKDALPPALYDGLVKERRGRGPKKTPVKKPVTIRVDPDVLRSYKSTEKGWQSRMNEVLRAGCSEISRLSEISTKVSSRISRTYRRSAANA